MSDPTDNALAAIASILDQTTAPPSVAKPNDKAEDKAFEPTEESAVSVEMPPPLPPSIEAAPAEPELIEQEPIEPEAIAQAEPSEPELPVEPEALQPSHPIEANGYSKVGPGPMAALRFRWTVREDAGHYYVDETVGESSTPLVNGPMDREAALNFVDDREAEARQRFAHFKREMLSRTATLIAARKDDSDA